MELKLANKRLPFRVDFRLSWLALLSLAASCFFACIVNRPTPAHSSTFRAKSLLSPIHMNLNVPSVYSKYDLFRLHNQEFAPSSADSIPLLFLPGNTGSYQDLPLLAS
ncbi:hypothetical protein HK096_001082, partial [Nowakowskiella sp. JEL0078]